MVDGTNRINNWLMGPLRLTINQQRMEVFKFSLLSDLGLLLYWHVDVLQSSLSSDLCQWKYFSFHFLFFQLYLHKFWYSHFHLSGGFCKFPLQYSYAKQDSNLPSSDILRSLCSTYWRFLFIYTATPLWTYSLYVSHIFHNYKYYIFMLASVMNTSQIKSMSTVVLLNFRV